MEVVSMSIDTTSIDTTSIDINRYNFNRSNFNRSIDTTSIDTTAGREVWVGGQLVLNKVPKVLLSYYVRLIITHLFTSLFLLPIFIREGGF